MRTGPSDRGSQYAAAQAATVNAHAAIRNGKRPASGNAPPRTARGARVAAASTRARAIAGRRCRAWIATASQASSRNTPATGLPSGVATDSTRASPRWRRRAASAARPSASPSANASRPMARLTTVPAAKSSDAAPARDRTTSGTVRSSRSKHTAAITALAAPTRPGPAIAPRGARRTL